MVTPFARALDLLSSFTAQDASLGCRELAERTGLPPSTVTRIARSLTELGYLHYSSETRRFRLAASVLALGYAAIANSSVQRSARARMREFSQEHQVHMCLGSRDRLEVVVVDSCIGAQLSLPLDLHVGSRMGIASSPMGWAMLAALPEIERYYLMENVERRMPREWPRMRRELGEAISQVHELGYCHSLGDWGSETATIAAPVAVKGQTPFVLSCIGSSSKMSRTRVLRDMGPKLLGMIAQIRETGVAE